MDKPNPQTSFAHIPCMLLKKSRHLYFDKKHKPFYKWLYILVIPFVNGNIYLTKKEYEKMFTGSKFKWKMYEGARKDDVVFFASNVMKDSHVKKRELKLEQQETERILRQAEGRMHREGQSPVITTIFGGRNVELAPTAVGFLIKEIIDETNKNENT